jgi:hypothetical protein
MNVHQADILQQIFNTMRDEKTIEALRAGSRVLLETIEAGGRSPDGGHLTPEMLELHSQSVDHLRKLVTLALRAQMSK